jgi:hypothetical protein
MDADTSIFKIQNKLAGEDEKEERFSLATDNIKSHISFKEHVGNFKSNNGESVVDLPVNQYSTTTDKFDWMMQKEKVLFATSLSLTSLVKQPNGLGKDYYSVSNIFLEITCEPLEPLKMYTPGAKESK